MSISKNDILQYRAIAEIRHGVKNDPALLARTGIFRSEKVELCRRVERYIASIKDPVKQYAMKTYILTDCTPDIAASVAVRHYKQSDLNGEHVRNITSFIRTERAGFKEDPEQRRRK